VTTQAASSSFLPAWATRAITLSLEELSLCGGKTGIGDRWKMAEAGAPERRRTPARKPHFVRFRWRWPSKLPNSVL